MAAAGTANKDQELVADEITAAASAPRPGPYLLACRDIIAFQRLGYVQSQGSETEIGDSRPKRFAASMSDSPPSEHSNASDARLRQRAAHDLKARLPPETPFVVHIAGRTAFDVAIKVDRGVHILTFFIGIGLDEARYERAISYAVDLVQDRLHRRTLPITSSQPDATTSFPAHPDLTPRHLVAVGATADVYRAHQSSVQRDVAVKVFRDRSEAAIAKAKSEAYKLAAVRHAAVPNLIAACDLDLQPRHTPHLILEWRDGRTLSDPDCLHHS